MARKAIADAEAAGIPYFRISATGFAPSSHGRAGDLDLWRSDPRAYWTLVDQMLDDLSARRVRVIPSFVWNVRQFPSMARETVRDLVTRPQSGAYQLLEKYVSEFVTRYRSHSAILFYEIGNELNLGADLNLVQRCFSTGDAETCMATGNYSTDEMIAFTRRVAAKIRAIDPARLISSGHSFPRPSAQHLRRSPESSERGADWTKDGVDQLRTYIRDTHLDFDVVSVHIYQEHPLPSFIKGDHAELIALAARIARELGKKLFVGEVGARSDLGFESSGFLGRALDRIRIENVSFATLWVWQYYQTSTYQSFDTPATKFNIEPGYSDVLIQRIAQMNGATFPRPVHVRDNQPPIVVLTWPLECARVGGAVRVHVAASDDSGFAPKVEVVVDGRRKVLGDRPPHSATLEGLADGENEIKVEATDRAGNRSAWASAVVAGKRAGAACSLCCEK
jgi:hypothetical protein